MLEPQALIFALHDPDESGELGWRTYRGEIRVDIDSKETAFVTPCNRITMTNAVCEMLRHHLEPLGVVWIRWWLDGELKGYSFEDSL